MEHCAGSKHRVTALSLQFRASFVRFWPNSGATFDDRAFGPAQASRAFREYLEGLDVASRPEAMRKNISTTDSAAQWTCAPGGLAFFAYSTNYLVDVRAGVIVDVEATSAHRTQEVAASEQLFDTAG
jgi:hypothetical protein